MRLIGIDAGTTSASGVLLNSETGEVEETVSLEHGASMTGEDPDLDIQDPELILEATISIKERLLERAEQLTPNLKGRQAVHGISLTGQVHGILYINGEGKHLSPLYTWQDTRGRRPAPGMESESWSNSVSRETGYLLPPGYGFLTHLINREEGRIPTEAAGLTSILGYLSMRLVGANRAALEPSDAHPLGLYRLEAGDFDRQALDKLKIRDSFVPEIVPAGTRIGTTEEGIDLFAAVGDNQAGYIGAVRAPRGQRLVSIGTSAQLSVHATDLPRTGKEEAQYGWTGQLEIRPFPGREFLLAGASIAGGSSYRLLENFFREVCRTFAGTDPGSLMERMNAVAYDELDERLKLDVSTRFLGTRRDPSVRGEIRGIGKANLTPDYMVEGFLRGIVDELNSYFGDLPRELREQTEEIVGVGNALRRNPLLRRILTEELGLPLRLPVFREEAALGAAIIAGVGAGAYDRYTSTERPIRYEPSSPE